MLRSATSVGAYYRESQRAKSDADFIHQLKALCKKLKKRCTGSSYWFELLEGSGVLRQNQVAELIQELDELIRIFVVMVCKVKTRIGR